MKLIPIIFEPIECACGCKEILNRFDSRMRERKYILGHVNKNKSNTWKIKDKVKIRTSRERAVKILRSLGINKCQVDNELCSGILEAHHIDKDPFNNNITNLNLLCRSHHRFADLRNLNLEELKDLHIKFIISSNKRRYRET